MAKLVRTLSQNPKCYLLHQMTFILLIALIMAYFGYCYMNSRKQRMEIIQAGAIMSLTKRHDLQGVELPRMEYPQPDVLTLSRNDVLVMTPWLAPIIWEGTFNIDILNEQFHLQNTTIGLTVFAIKSYIVFLKLFLETAEIYFMARHRVHYYVFTDRPDHVPYLHLQKGRQIIILKVQSYACWEDISMHHMEMISNFSQQRFHQEVDYVVCADVDLKFSDHVGMEILSSLFGTLHLSFYCFSRNNFPSERRPLSQAHISEDEGDSYYTGALFWGLVMEVYRLTKTCHQAMMVDQANYIEAVWHDESHLNKYLLHHKPSKLLSPEHMWSKQLWDYTMRHQMEDLPSSIKRFRVNVLHKNQRVSN